MQKYQVKIEGAKSDQVLLVKRLRTVGNIGLKEAHSLSLFIKNHGGCILVAGVDREVADHVVALLQPCCSRVTIEPSSVEVPMFLRPEVSSKYRWNGWMGPLLVRR